MITTCIWFTGEAEEAAHYYTGIFPDGKILSISRFGEEGREIHGQDPGKAMAVKFIVNGQELCALNGNPNPVFSESLSLQVHLNTQDEIDHLWNSLTAGGSESMCGWCKDKFGISWQIIPSILGEVMSDPVRRPHAIRAMMSMKKMIIKDLLEA